MSIQVKSKTNDNSNKNNCLWNWLLRAVLTSLKCPELHSFSTQTRLDPTEYNKYYKPDLLRQKYHPSLLVSFFTLSTLLRKIVGNKRKVILKSEYCPFSVSTTLSTLVHLEMNSKWHFDSLVKWFLTDEIKCWILTIL